MIWHINGITICAALQLIATPSLLGAPLATFRLQVEDLNDHAIASVTIGQDFQLAAYVQDIRDPTGRFPGVWAAFMNVAYEAGLVSIASLPPINPNPADPGNRSDPGIEWGDYFDTGLRFGDLSVPGQIDGIGSASLASVPSGLGELLLWRITIHTSALGTVIFNPSFDSDPNHDSFFIDPPIGLSTEQIQFIGDSVQIVPEPSSFILAALGFIGLIVWRRRKR